MINLVSIEKGGGGDNFFVFEGGEKISYLWKGGGGDNFTYPWNKKGGVISSRSTVLLKFVVQDK